MSKTLILDLTNLEFGWYEGAPLLDQETGLPIRSAASVPYENTFLAVGGYIEAISSSTESIYKYDAVSGEWNQLPVRLVEPRAGSQAFLLPEGYFPCEEVA